jgi:hypothetical protein
MTTQNSLTGTQKLELARSLLTFLKAEIPENYHCSIEEILMLAYHANTSTHDLRCLVSAIG